jgi:hypothetical protein
MQNSIPAHLLVRAFELAWLRMLNDELITANIILVAPTQLMTAVIGSAGDADEPEALSERAVLKWRSEFDRGSATLMPSARSSSLH